MTTYNFSAGPAMLPKEVLEQAQTELLDYQGTGMSVMEMSHRSSDFVKIAEEAEKSLRSLMSIPENYSVLFLQGGATLQFAAIPMNLLGDKKKAGYINTGQWSAKAIKAAGKYCEPTVLASSEESNHARVPDLNNINITDDLAYVHITPNETIGGLKYSELPNTNGVPLVADMSSMILSEEVDVTKYGLIYAGAQKNVGPAGLTIVIIRNDLLGRAADITPDTLNYTVMSEKDSMLNTPPTYSLYVAGLVFKYLEEMGGLSEMERRNKEKAALLYEYIDNSKFYSNPIEPKYRSLMNVPFILANDSKNELFLSEAKEAGLVTLKGHRSVGGMRASIYNAMPLEGVQTLINFMQNFEKENV